MLLFEIGHPPGDSGYTTSPLLNNIFTGDWGLTRPNWALLETRLGQNWCWRRAGVEKPGGKSGRARDYMVCTAQAGSTLRLGFNYVQ